MSEGAGSGASRSALLGIALASSLLLVVVALPRFGALSEPPIPGNHDYTTADGRELTGLTIDMREYLHLTEYFGGTADAPDLAPFTSRIAAPWLAGQLPWEAPVSLNVVMLGCLIVGLISMIAAQDRLGCGVGPIALSSLAYSVSFPVFYWGSFNYVDGAVVGLLGVFVLTLVRRDVWLAVSTLGVGLLFKESALVALPALVVWIWLAGYSVRQRWVLLAGTAGATLAGLVGARMLGPPASRFYNPWFPSPSDVMGYLGWNLSRVGPLGQVVLTGVLPLALALYAWRLSRTGRLGLDPQTFWALTAGVVTGILLNLHALFAAQIDGRTLWTVYPFALTLGAVALSVRSQRRDPATAVALTD